MRLQCRLSSWLLQHPLIGMPRGMAALVAAAGLIRSRVLSPHLEPVPRAGAARAGDWCRVPPSGKAHWCRDR